MMAQCYFVATIVLLTYVYDAIVLDFNNNNLHLVLFYQTFQCDIDTELLNLKLHFFVEGRHFESFQAFKLVLGSAGPFLQLSESKLN